MIYSLKTKDELKDLVELDDLQSKVKQVRLVEKLGKQGFHYDVKELFEPITKTLTDTSQKLLAETKSNTKAIENLDESNKYVRTLELMNKKEKIHSSFIRHIAKLLVANTESQFRLLDDRDSGHWNDYEMHGENVTVYDDKLVFRDTGVVYTLKGDTLSLIPDYCFNETDSPDAKKIINCFDEIHFNIHVKSKSSRDKNLLKKLLY